jgi:hypothetical protein
MTDPVAQWWTLPEPTRTQVLTLLARLITRVVLVEADRCRGDRCRGEQR